MTEPIFYAQQVTCPHCGKTFENNKINGMALIAVLGSIEARKRMYCKLTLDDFERLSKRDGAIGFTEAKKIILDNFNDFERDIHTFMGWGNEVE
jgi:hypothetical protein